MGKLRTVRKVAARVLIGFVLFMVIGNAAIVGVHLWAQKTAAARPGVTAPKGVHNFEVVDEKVWRGSRPTALGYRSLIDRGVETIVDLRAESGLERPTTLLSKNDVELVRIPIRDGQVPTDAQVAKFLSAVESSHGKVYVHCMAGVGRTGAMVGAYLVELKNASAIAALRHNLSVGPPSLEQIVFVAGDIDEPNPVVTGVSRVLDGPRRIWSYFN